jgi:hypothetical protein
MSMSGLAMTWRASATTCTASPTMLRGALGVQVGHHGDLDATPGAARISCLVALQHLEGAAADGADAEQADLDGGVGS